MGRRPRSGRPAARTAPPGCCRSCAESSSGLVCPGMHGDHEGARAMRILAQETLLLEVAQLVGDARRRSEAQLGCQLAHARRIADLVDGALDGQQGAPWRAVSPLVCSASGERPAASSCASTADLVGRRGDGGADHRCVPYAHPTASVEQMYELFGACLGLRWGARRARRSKTVRPFLLGTWWEANDVDSNKCLNLAPPGITVDSYRRARLVEVGQMTVLSVRVTESPRRTVRGAGRPRICASRWHALA